MNSHLLNNMLFTHSIITFYRIITYNWHIHKIIRFMKVGRLSGSLLYYPCFAWNQVHDKSSNNIKNVWKNSLWHWFFCTSYPIFVFKYIYTLYSILFSLEIMKLILFPFTFFTGETHGIGYYIYTSGSTFP